MPNSILVTGSTGFVGRLLCNRLLSQGVSVRGTILTPDPPASFAAGLSPVVIKPLESGTQWHHALAGINTVIHLAARVHLMDDPSADPIVEFRRVNVDGTARLASEAVKSGVRRFVFVSTIKVNGEESSHPYTPDSIPRPVDAYGLSKWEAEQQLWQIAEKTGMEVVIIRPTLVYGPGVKANFLNLMKALQREIPLPLASLTNKRSLIYVDNLVDALVTCATHPAAAGKTYLVSDGEDVSTPELIRRTASALDVPSRLFHVPPSLMRIAGKLIGKSILVDRLIGSLTVDISKIRVELGWQPPFTMQEGLKVTADWYRSTYGKTV